MAAAFDRAGFDALDVHMTDLLAGRRVARRLPRLRRLRRLLLRRRARRGRGLGQVDPVQRARARRVRGVLRARRHVRARRVQRLPDDEQPARSSFPGAAHWPHFVRNRSEQFEARLVLVEVAAIAVAVLRAAWKAAAFRSPPRTAKAMPSSATPRSSRRRSRSSRCASSTTAASRPSAIPYNPNGSPQRHHRAHHAPTAASRS